MYRTIRQITARLLALVLVVFNQGCSDGAFTSSAVQQRTFKPMDAEAAVLWDRQTTENATLLHDLAARYNKQQTGLPIKIVKSGTYGDIYRKVIASIQAQTLPAMTVAYENMTRDYAQAGAVVPLDEFIEDPDFGLSPESFDDIFPAMRRTNTFADLDNKMYSFPYTKSVLVMYFNKRLMREAGIIDPPETWGDFLTQCRQIHAKTGIRSWAIAIDCSTIDAMIYTMGGEIVADGVTHFDSVQARRVFSLIETAATEGWAFHVPPRTYDDQTAFTQDRVAFLFRTSTLASYLSRDMEDQPDAWGISPIPQDDPANPKTVLYGANISICNTTPEQKVASWQFIKWFTSPEITVQWALETGYLPVRKSAEDHPDMKKFWGQWAYNKVPFDCLEGAIPEPNINGWQEIRDLVEKAETAVLTRAQTAQKATAELKREADRILQRHRARANRARQVTP